MSSQAVAANKPAPARVSISELEWLGLEFLLMCHLTAEDKADLFGQVPTENPLEVAHRIMQSMSAQKGIGRIVMAQGRPKAAFGVYEVHRGCWAIWSLGVNDPKMALTLLRPLLETAIPHVRKHGGRRIECKTRCDRRGMRDLLKLLGFRVEGVLHRYGAQDGADYLQFGYLVAPEAPKVDDVPVAEQRRPTAEAAAQVAL